MNIQILPDSSTSIANIVSGGIAAGVVEYGVNYALPQYQLGGSSTNDALLIGAGIAAGKTLRKFIEDNKDTIPASLKNSLTTNPSVYGPLCNVGGTFAANMWTPYGSTNNNKGVLAVKAVGVGMIADMLVSSSSISPAMQN